MVFPKRYSYVMVPESARDVSVYAMPTATLIAIVHGAEGLPKKFLQKGASAESLLEKDLDDAPPLTHGSILMRVEVGQVKRRIHGIFWKLQVKAQWLEKCNTLMRGVRNKLE
jgi:hypothetical protein